MVYIHHFKCSIRSFTLMQKNQNIKARKLRLNCSFIFLKSQKLAQHLSPLLLRQLLFFNENNSTILNVCIPPSQLKISISFAKAINNKILRSNSCLKNITSINLFCALVFMLKPLCNAVKRIGKLFNRKKYKSY